MDSSPETLVRNTLHFIEDLENAWLHLDRSYDREANAEYEYRKQKAKAWIGIEGRTGEERLDKVNGLTAQLRRERDLATGKTKAALELVRNKRQSLSALQTLLNSIEEESQHSRVGPEYDSGLADRVEQERAKSSVRN